MVDVEDRAEETTILPWYMTCAIRNAVDLPDGRIDCQIEHPIFGWIDYTASANDVDEQGVLIYQRVSALP